jgi:hypothetical protein
MTIWFFKKNKEIQATLEPSDTHLLSQRNMKVLCLKILPHLTLITLFFGFFGLAFFVKHETTQIKFILHVSTEREAEILSTLNDLQSQINSIKTDLEQIREIKETVIRLEHTVATEHSVSGLAKAAQLQRISDQLQQLEKRQVSKKSAFLRKNHAHASKSAKSSLPFIIKSLDMMAGQPFISVEYQQNTIPLRTNESLADWKALKIDVTTGVVIWENLKTRRQMSMVVLGTVYV